jgi:hypothetical protein
MDKFGLALDGIATHACFELIFFRLIYSSNKGMEQESPKKLTLLKQICDLNYLNLAVAWKG